MTEEMGGQMTLFDRDTWCGKMFPEHSVPATPREKTSESSLKKSPGSKSRTPLFLDLRGGRWSHSGCIMGERWSLAWRVHDAQFWESPKEENASRLSQILEDTAHPKYSLSAKACLGILRRAEKRGKELPSELREALEWQAGCDPQN